MKFSSSLLSNSKLNGGDLLTLRRKSFTPIKIVLLTLAQKSVFASGPVWTGTKDLAVTAFRTPNTLAPSG
jgi:hypothetical protein